jgi:hypothetical protein
LGSNLNDIYVTNNNVLTIRELPLLQNHIYTWYAVTIGPMIVSASSPLTLGSFELGTHKTSASTNRLVIKLTL